jgi:hypothetical protein
MASEMSFRELYDHLEEYVPDREQRWKSCMRVKRHISDPNAHGGSGADQVYFEGEEQLDVLSSYLDLNPVLHYSIWEENSSNDIKIYVLGKGAPKMHVLGKKLL